MCPQETKSLRLLQSWTSRPHTVAALPVCPTDSQDTLLPSGHSTPGSPTCGLTQWHPVLTSAWSLLGLPHSFGKTEASSNTPSSIGDTGHMASQTGLAQSPALGFPALPDHHPRTCSLYFCNILFFLITKITYVQGKMRKYRESTLQEARSPQKQLGRTSSDCVCFHTHSPAVCCACPGGFVESVTGLVQTLAEQAGGGGVPCAAFGERCP